MRRILALLIVLSAGACGGDDDDDDDIPDAAGDAGGGADAGTDAPPGCNGDFAAFVIDLVQNQTRDDNDPVQIDGCTFTDSEDPAAFDSLF